MSPCGGSVTSWSPLPPDPKVINRFYSLSFTSHTRLMKMHWMGKLLCHTDNPDACWSDKVPLWNLFPLFAASDGSDAPGRVIFCVFVMESKVWPQADGAACVLELEQHKWTPWLRPGPVKTPLRSVGFKFLNKHRKQDLEQLHSFIPRLLKAAGQTLLCVPVPFRAVIHSFVLAN